MVPSARNFWSADRATAAITRLISAARPNADLMFLIAQLQGRTLLNSSAMHFSRVARRLGRKLFANTALPKIVDVFDVKAARQDRLCAAKRFLVKETQPS